MILYIILFFVSFFFSALLTAALIFLFSIIQVKQIERNEGPQSHKKKSGTPTMGGIGFVVVSVALGFVFANIWPIILLFLGYALIGFADDFIKVFLKRNLGLTFWQKIITQTILAFLFSYYISYNTSHFLFSDLFQFMGFHIYILFSTFLIVGCANAANLTDGLDGLLSGTSILVFISFFCIALYKSPVIKSFPYASGLSAVIAGAIFGFLIFNFPKAKIFMGDTGSLAIGAAVAGFSIILCKELLLVVVGGIFLVEALSVIIQVASYKLFKKRVFKMSPIHHHFELLGWGETKVVLMFWFAQIILSIAGILLA
ncbi:phospho-N-acetylmuramoyl-pentapeptide-transferase [candidate division WOR-1 bacterium RIFOXYB2_FULL_37_13]|uniref:Phospho-N-acetylmuramoyl-pentapeptide-transferase n=1 Tax=candidate division WOR-1 bacterium RIFOXYB2_FULL_37_13 TaxID=1802579 RepID=A0A1F4SY97_UNCSA|nr:MAG: phospho-N-acetylmuramoyl-pentapeptide-transferase [candidate division WOR-1 bacterium RIFOXYB2_FULL_37_13]